MKQCARLLLAISLCIAAAALSSTLRSRRAGGTTSLSGTVADASGAVIPGATVAVKNNATGGEYPRHHERAAEAFTDPVGESGHLHGDRHADGIQDRGPQRRARQRWRPGVGARSPLEVGGLEETVVVAGRLRDRPDAVRGRRRRRSTRTRSSKLPTGSRSALDFVTSLPGVNTPGGSRDSTINGLPQSAINITIDGMSAQDNHLKTGDGFFARVSPRLDAIEEVTVSIGRAGRRRTPARARCRSSS